MTILNLNSDTSHLQVWHSTPLIGTIYSLSYALSFSRKVVSNYYMYMTFQHRWSNNSSRFVSRHARIQGFSSGGGGPGPSVIKNLWQRFFLILFRSPPLSLQNANGLFQRKLYFSKVPEGLIFSSGGGGGGIQLLIPPIIPYNLCFSRGSVHAIFGSTGCCDKS